MWRFVVGKLDHERLIFVDEMGTHTSLAPLYGYSPAVSGRSSRYRETGARTRLSWRVSAAKGWGLLWSWKALLAGKS